MKYNNNNNNNMYMHNVLHISYSWSIIWSTFDLRVRGIRKYTLRNKNVPFTKGELISSKKFVHAICDRKWVHKMLNVKTGSCNHHQQVTTLLCPGLKTVLGLKSDELMRVNKSIENLGLYIYHINYKEFGMFSVWWRKI